MNAWWIGLLWFAAAVGSVISSSIAGEPTPLAYWFFLGAALFFFGVSYIAAEIRKAGKK